jgi:hypothetical protein
MVSDTPRKLDKLVIADATASEPFTYALNNLSGRSSLINFLTGSGVDGRSEKAGHSNMATTQRYIDLRPAMLKAAVELV